MSGMTSDISELKDLKSQYREQLDMVRKENKELTVQVEDQKTRLKMITEKLGAFEANYDQKESLSLKSVSSSPSRSRVVKDEVKAMGNGWTWSVPVREKEESQMNG